MTGSEAFFNKHAHEAGKLFEPAAHQRTHHASRSPTILAASYDREPGSSGGHSQLARRTTNLRSIQSIASSRCALRPPHRAQGSPSGSHPERHAAAVPTNFE